MELVTKAIEKIYLGKTKKEVVEELIKEYNLTRLAAEYIYEKAIKEVKYYEV